MTEDSIASLKPIPLFKSLMDNDLKLIFEKLENIEYEAGHNIINEGEMGTCLYLIREGVVKVVSRMDEFEEPIVLSRLGSGDYFGEMALITGEPRSASVVAENDVKLWRLSKSDFDQLILQNPSITLSLTHMLSHRLRQANLAREKSERFYKQKIAPRGSLEDVDVIKLLKYAEENSLTGSIQIRHDKQKAVFHYEKGQLAELDFAGKEENEAMDEILGWQQGDFLIEPKSFTFGEESEKLEPDESKKDEDEDIRSVFLTYFTEKLEELVQLAGSRHLKFTVNKANDKLGRYFEVQNQFQFTIMPELEIRLPAAARWNDRCTLFLAVLLRDVINTLAREMIGMEFWSPQSQNAQINQKLSELQFFQYYQQAQDLVHD